MIVSQLVTSVDGLAYDTSALNYNKYSSRNGNAITRITIHHCAGVMNDLNSMRSCIRNPSREMSCNYFITNSGTIYCMLPENFRAWTSSNGANDRRAITIEVSNSAVNDSWPVSNEAMSALISLCTDICRRYGIVLVATGNANTDTLTRHNMFTSTTCPGPFLQSRFETIATMVNNKAKESGYYSAEEIRTLLSTITDSKFSLDTVLLGQTYIAPLEISNPMIDSLKLSNKTYKYDLKVTGTVNRNTSDLKIILFDQDGKTIETLSIEGSNLENLSDGGDEGSTEDLDDLGAASEDAVSTLYLNTFSFEGSFNNLELDTTYKIQFQGAGAAGGSNEEVVQSAIVQFKTPQSYPKPVTNLVLHRDYDIEKDLTSPDKPFKAYFKLPASSFWGAWPNRTDVTCTKGYTLMLFVNNKVVASREVDLGSTYALEVDFSFIPKRFKLTESQQKIDYRCMHRDTIQIGIQTWVRIKSKGNTVKVANSQEILRTNPIILCPETLITDRLYRIANKQISKILIQNFIIPRWSR